MSRTFIIAEVGVNHNANLDMALQLIDVARAAGADAVELHTGPYANAKDGPARDLELKKLLDAGEAALGDLLSPVLDL